MDPRVPAPKIIDSPNDLAIDLYADLLQRLADLGRASDDPGLSPAMRAFLALSWADMWIGNGGFAGLWQGRTATIRGLPDAAALIGAVEFASLFRDANAALPPGALADDDALAEVDFGPLEAIEGVLTDRYYELDELAEMLGDFVIAHPDEFFS